MSAISKDQQKIYKHANFTITFLKTENLSQKWAYVKIFGSSVSRSKSTEYRTFSRDATTFQSRSRPKLSFRTSIKQRFSLS